MGVSEMLAGGRRRWAWLVLGSTVLIAMACQGGRGDPTPSPDPTATLAPVPPTAAPKAADEERERKYRALADQIMNGTGEMTRVLSGIGIGLAGRPEGASEAKETVEAVISFLELARERLGNTEPPPGYEKLHQTLLDALSIYTQASAALLPDTQTGKADYPRFQELMPQGGKNFHAAGAEMSNLTRLKN